MIPVYELPAIFHEAVLLTSALKIRYLWINSLCIVQDDPDDWEAEAAKWLWYIEVYISRSLLCILPPAMVAYFLPDAQHDSSLEELWQYSKGSD
jgi:hypothetical protein